MGNYNKTLNRIVRILKKKKAKDIVILDLKDLTELCDYFVICTIDSDKQGKSIVEKIIQDTKSNRLSLHHIEDDPECKWILLDFGEVVLHIFSEEARRFWDLEHLWTEAQKIIVE